MQLKPKNVQYLYVGHSFLEDTMTALNWERARNTWTPREVRYDTLKDAQCSSPPRSRSTTQHRHQTEALVRESAFEQLRQYVQVASDRSFRLRPQAQRHAMQACIRSLLLHCQPYRMDYTPEEAVLTNQAVQLLYSLRH